MGCRKIIEQYGMASILLVSGMQQAWAKHTNLSHNHIRPAIELDEVQVIGHKTDPHHAKFFSAGSYEYLDERDIERNRGASVGDFLRGIPGVLVGDVRNNGGVNVNIRGMQGEGRVPVVIDGSLQAVPVFRGYYGSSTRTYLDPDLMVSANIEKGPSLSADAVGATGGIMHMKTISAQDVIPEGKDWGIRLSGGIMNNTVPPPKPYTRGGYQTEFIAACNQIPAGASCAPYSHAPNSRTAAGRTLNANGLNGSIAVAKKWDSFDLMLAYAHKKQGNYFVGKHGVTPTVASIRYEDDLLFNGSEIKVGKVKFENRKGFTLYRPGEEALNTAQDNRSILFKAGWHMDDAHAAELAYRGYYSQFGEIMPSILGFRSDGARQGDGSEVKVNAYTLNYRFTPDSPLVDLKANIWKTKADNSSYSPLFEDYGYSDSRNAMFFVSRQFGLGLENKSIIDLLSRPLSLSYGVSANRESIAPPADAQARVEKKGYPKNAIAAGYIREGKRREWSAFVSGNYPLNRYVTVDGGIRYLHTVNEDFRPYQEFKGYLPDPITGEYTASYGPKIYTKPIKTSGFSPIIAITVVPKEGWQLYAKYASALRAPSLFQSSRGFSNSGTVPNLVTLKPEQAKNWEFGVNHARQNIWLANDQLLTKLAYFHNKTDDYLTRTRVQTSPHSWEDQTTNIDSVKFKGFELAVKYDSGQYYGQLAGIYYTDSQFCVLPTQVDINVNRTGKLCSRGGVHSSNIGNHLPPKKSVALTLGSRFWAQKLDAGVRLNYHDKRMVPTVKADNANGLTSEEWRAYTLLDVYMDYQLSKNATVNFAIDNLTNRYYLDAVNVGLNPAPGRLVRLGFKMKF